MSYVPPSNPQQYPVIFTPGEYGYFPSIQPFDDDDHADAPQLALGTSPIIATGSPFTYTNTDSKGRKQLVYFQGDPNASLVYKNQLTRRGVAVVTLAAGESIVVSYTGATPNLVLTQLTDTSSPGSIS